MLGLTLGKILVTILIIVVVWKGFALVNRLARERKAQLQRQASRGGARHRQGAIELVQCKRCGAYFDPGERCACGARRG